MRLSSLFLLFVAPPAADAPLSLPSNAVVLVVAGWCAPCRGELVRLDDLAAAARPRNLLVAPLDDGASTRTMMAGVPAARRWTLAPAQRLRLAALVHTRSAGLPYAFATDGQGQRCADLAGGLDAPRTRALVARCLP